MVNRKTILALAALAVCVVALVAFNGTTEAQTASSAAAFGSVQIVTYPSGLTGFFDTNTGVLYIYDKTWDKCVFVRRLNQLGAPMAEVGGRR